MDLYWLHVWDEVTPTTPCLKKPGACYCLSTSLTINETAFQLGFEHPQYFTRLFNGKTGQTPAAFRQSAGFVPE